MRLRVGLLLCLFAILAGVGCRKALAPNIDRNKAPETWISAAPFDTVTLTKGTRPQIGTIPIRFHVYWAGTDQDGAVVGYYWAVVETLVTAQPGEIGPPPLPGPKARDYHFTVRTDSTFIFNVAENHFDRLHAFFIYSVDDQGKPDPTPARFIFDASDRFPPRPVFEVAQARGTIYFFDPGGALRSETRTFLITDSLNFATSPRDTVPSGSRVTFRFHAEPTVLGSVVKGFRYKLDEAELQPRDPDLLYLGLGLTPQGFPWGQIEYHVPPNEADPARGGLDTLSVASGTKVFTLRAVDQASGSVDSTRRFQLNFSPETWFAGPDPNVPALPFTNPTDVLTPGVWYLKPNGEKVAVLDPLEGKIPPAGLAGSMMGPDSVQIFPALRRPFRTFLEVWGDTVFLRREGDTVHMASWAIFHNGGFDRDSPYSVRVADGVALIMPSFPGGPVLGRDKQNGSPIGFRSIVPVYLNAGAEFTPFSWAERNGPLAITAQSNLYPFFDPSDVLHFPRLAAYHPMFQSGKAYALQRAEDGDGARDGRVLEPRPVGENPSDPLRSQVLVFYVNYPPELQTESLIFRPRVAQVDTFYSQNWDLRLPGSDVDPYVSGDRVGGPSPAKVLRIRLAVTGKDTLGGTLRFYDPLRSGIQQKYVNVSDINLLVPPDLATGPVTLTVELCDCPFCENNQGEGRCISRDIQVYYVRPPIVSTKSASRPGLN
jgi:hypothetical protein